MEDAIRNGLATRLLAIADDELILGHRNSEWAGHAPILEEDIAFANIAQDEMGHAIIWYELREALTGEDPDRLVFFRNASAYRNAPLVELPNGDWAFTMMRQFLFDSYEQLLLQELTTSKYRPLAEAAEKMRPEELYHYRHTSNWVRRLGHGTDESHQRSQEAVNQLWPFFDELFSPLAGEDQLAYAGVVPDSAALEESWRENATVFLQEAGLTPTVSGDSLPFGRKVHTEHLGRLLSEMQEVARLDPDATW